MKISEMDTAHAADVLVRIAQPVANIMDDPKVEKVIRDLPDTRNGSIMHMVAALLPRVVPLALKDHRQDLFEIVGALGNMPLSEVEKANILVTMAILRDSVDKELLDFFDSSAGQTTQDESES